MIKSILKFFSTLKNEINNTSEKEIYILTSLSTFAGGSKFTSDKYWTCGQTFVAYVDCKTNELYKTEERISWQTEDNTKHPFNFEPKTIYKVKINYTKKNNYSTFSFIEVLESNAKNEQLLSLMDEFFITDSIADFEFDKKSNSAEGDIDWLGEDILVYLSDVSNTTIAKQSLLHLKKMVKNIRSWDDHLKTFIATQTLDKVNEWIVDHDEYSKITKDVLKEESIINDIEISPNGDFFITYILKTYRYMINVEGNANGKLEKAYLEE